MPEARCAGLAGLPVAGGAGGRAGAAAGGLPPASCRTPVMAAASAGPRVNRRIPSRSGFGGVTAVTVPSAATWQVIPAGQAPSRTAAMPVRRPASRMPGQPAVRALPAGGDQRDARPARAGSRAGVRQVVVRAPAAGPGSAWRLSSSSRAASSVAGTARPGIAGRAGAGQQPGGVGGRDDHGGQPGLGGRGLGEQAGEDRAGGRLGAGAGQAEAAEGGDVDGGLAARRRGCRAGPCRAAARAGRGAPAPAAARCCWVPRRARRRRRPRPAPGRLRTGRGTGRRRPGPRYPGPGFRLGAGAGRAARRRALMTSGSGGVSGSRLLGGPGRGR